MDGMMCPGKLEPRPQDINHLYISIPTGRQSHMALIYHWLEIFAVWTAHYGIWVQTAHHRPSTFTTSKAFSWDTLASGPALEESHAHWPSSDVVATWRGFNQVAKTTSSSMPLEVPGCGMAGNIDSIYFVSPCLSSIICMHHANLLNLLIQNFSEVACPSGKHPGKHGWRSDARAQCGNMGSPASLANLAFSTRGNKAVGLPKLKDRVLNIKKT